MSNEPAHTVRATARLSSIPHREITRIIIGTFYDVHSELGSGFLESVYANALTVALIGSTLRVERQVRFEVDFRGVSVGRYVADSWSNPRSWWRRKQRARSTRCTGHSCSITCEPPASRSASS